MSDSNRSKSSRIEPRAIILPKEIKGILAFPVADDPNHQQPFIIYDVSKSGIGLWTPAAVPIGQQVHIAVNYPYILQLRGEGRWCEENKDQGFRCGILITHNQAKLEALYESFSRLAEKILSGHS